MRDEGRRTGLKEAKARIDELYLFAKSVGMSEKWLKKFVLSRINILSLRDRLAEIQGDTNAATSKKVI